MVLSGINRYLMMIKGGEEMRNWIIEVALSIRNAYIRHGEEHLFEVLDTLKAEMTVEELAKYNAIVKGINLA